MLPIEVCACTPNNKYHSTGNGNKIKFYFLFPGMSEIHYTGPDLEDVRESVRQGVTKVAGRLSSLASGVMSSFQDKYGG